MPAGRDAPDFDDAAGVPDPDARRKMRFLHPQNPRSQPLPKGANLWRYTGVDGVQALRPQNRPEPTVIADGEGTEPGYRFRYLPDVAAPGTIDVTYIRTAPGLFPKVDPWRNPPGTNFLPTVFSNAFDLLTQEMPNTLASTPYIPFNLHAAPRGQKSTPDVRPLASRNSPADDRKEPAASHGA